jgi:hypothetical protein
MGDGHVGDHSVSLLSVVDVSLLSSFSSLVRSRLFLCVPCSNINPNTLHSSHDIETQAHVVYVEKQSRIVHPLRSQTSTPLNDSAIAHTSKRPMSANSSPLTASVTGGDVHVKNRPGELVRRMTSVRVRGAVSTSALRSGHSPSSRATP